MSICKVARRKNNFGVVTADVMQNKALSSDARFLIAMVATLPPDWKFYIKWLQEHSGWSKNKLRKVMAELIEHGHLVRTREILAKATLDPRDGRKAFKAGQFNWTYDFFLEPEAPTESIDQKRRDANCSAAKVVDIPCSSEPAAPPSSSDNPSKKRERVAATNQPETVGDGARPLSASQEKAGKAVRVDSPLVTAIAEFLAKELEEPEARWQPDSPMIRRTARCLASRAVNMDEFKAMHQAEVNEIFEFGYTLKAARKLFQIDKEEV